MKSDLYFTIEKLTKYLDVINSLVYRQRLLLEPYRYIQHTSETDKPLIDGSIQNNNFKQADMDLYWTQPNCHLTLRSQFSIPPSVGSKTSWAVFVRFEGMDNGMWPEALAYIDGQAVCGINRNHREIHLDAKYADDQSHDLALHTWTGRDDHFEQHGGIYLRFPPAELVEIDRPTRQFVRLARVTLESINEMSPASTEKWKLLVALDEAFLQLDLREPFDDRFYNSVPAVHERLAQQIPSCGKPLDVNTYAIGHSHIDVAWLWNLNQTRYKCGRTFSTIFRLMEEYDDFFFTQSQPQLYEYVRQDHPRLFEQIKQKVTEGRWEPIGGMWVESDCNVSGPEALVRQLLLGRQFFTEHFGPGADSPVLWLVDTFGFCWTLPQLIKQADMDYFFTAKLFWNQYNLPEDQSFWWQGLDGTRVLTHIAPAPDKQGQGYLYNGRATPHELMQQWITFRQKDVQQDMVHIFGHGDGGGGPTSKMLDTIQTLENFPGMPQVHHSKAIDFFETLNQKYGDKLPVWNDELYFEAHRGVYTTQARNKKANRKCEFLLHDVEFLATAANQLDKTFEYPYDQLQTAWRLLCLNQFHDILPGSSIGDVYDESLEQYAQIEQIAQSIKENALKTISARLQCNMLIVNPTSFARQDPLLYCEPVNDNESLQEAADRHLAVQPIDDGTLIHGHKLPPYSIVPVYKTANELKPELNETTLIAEPQQLENDHLRIELNDAGDITRIFDKDAGREVLRDDQIANQFQAFQDRPLSWNAWDIEVYFEEKMWLAEPARSVEVVESGPIRATLKIERQILKSRYTQTISINATGRRIDFDTHIDWHEKHTLLKAAFGVDILARQATYEIQWGNIQRTTHRNRKADFARFEVCAQKWVDLSEGNYGVSLLNDCKYGHDIKDGLMRISLLRGTTQPDKDADQGEHRFAYSLLPHIGPWNEETIRQAYALNDPLMLYCGENAEPNQDIAQPLSLVQSPDPNIVIETIKTAQDGNGMIVRFYEAMGWRGPVTIKTGFTIKKCSRTNLLERNLDKIDHQDSQITLPVRPYEIVTLRINV